MHVLARLIATLIGIALLVTGTFWTLGKATAQEGVVDDLKQYTLDASALDTELQRIVAANPDLVISISAIDLQSGTAYNYGETSSYVAASITKLLTATLYLHHVELGRASLSDQIGAASARSQLEKLIVESDNEAWHAFNEALGAENLEAYAQKWGIASYDATENTITSEDTARLLHRLSTGALLNNEHTALLLGHMQRANMRNYLVAGTPEGSTAYHKVGYLADRLHDAGIVKKGDRSFVLVIFSKSAGSYSFGKGATLLQDITRTASDAFFP